jgi:outer membrane receptor for ferrienterochelin and colicins
MKQAIGFLLALCLSLTGTAQHILTIRIKDARTKEPLPGATIRLSGMSPTLADSAGTTRITGIPNGRHILRTGHVGYRSGSQTIDLPAPGDTLTILLEPAEKEMGEVVVSSTRSSRTLRNIPTRVEVINGEELEEKGNMRPGDIRMMLNETTGIQTQQVSATSANSSIRIQGLDGRYTQILKDGFPLYAGFSGGLGLLQTPPLDLRQVEIIKGASSTLYGGGAIAGLVNLISKTPGPDRELRGLINGTSAGGLDINGYYGRQFGKAGITIYASQNSSRAYAPGNTIFTAIPRTRRNVVEPRLFLDLSPRTRLVAGISATWENRLGGDIMYLDGKGDSTHSYYERNKSSRISTQLSLDHRWSDRSSLTIKNAYNHFDRTITIPGYVFDGSQSSTYSEAAWHYKSEASDWIAGINLYTDDFREHPRDNFPIRSYTQTSTGVFLQNTWKANSWLQTETGLRGDYIAHYGWAILPRISALFQLAPNLTSRLGGGLGYKTPTIFTEETERIQLQNVLPVSPDSNRLERSYGLNLDFNYRLRISDKSSINFNQLFFFTRINHPLELSNGNPTAYHLVNGPGYIDSKGLETNIKFSYDDFRWYIGYTYTDAHLKEGGRIRENPLTVRNRLNNILMYEIEDKFKIGFEAYYYSWQDLTDGTRGKPYWTFGLMGEKIWEHFSLFINFENFTNTRQTRFDTIYTGTVTHPVFRDIYAPLDGIVVNGGIKLKL